jgi:hypothetical protein
MLVHRRERGGETEARRFDSLLLRLDDLQTEVTRLETQIAEARRGPRSSQPQPQPQPAATEIATERAQTTQ